MSDNTSQQRAGLFRFPELDTFRIVKGFVTESHLAQYSKAPGLSEEQHKKLIEALQAVVKTGKFADLKSVMAAMMREESNKIHACFKEVCCFRDRKPFHDKWQNDFLSLSLSLSLSLFLVCAYMMCANLPFTLFLGRPQAHDRLPRESLAVGRRGLCDAGSARPAGRAPRQALPASS